ncbi:MAG: DsrE family protein [Anaerolineales bacterium]|nr:DsrE family protein [Anaerolineales bacterium]
MKDTVLQCTTFGMGHTNIHDLNMKLIKKYFDILLQSSEYPAAIAFYTDGVQLTTEGSPILEQLGQLESKGVRLIICSTCLDEMKIADKVKVGIAGGMPDIIEAQMKASKVITI